MTIFLPFKESLLSFSVPKAPPQNVSLLSFGPSNLTVFWSDLDNTWGEIKYYLVHFYSTMRKFGTIKTEDNYFSFTGLNRSTAYMAEVQGATSKGEGPLSIQASGKTLLRGKKIY